MPAIKKIIVFRPGALGDTLLTFPALAALRHVFAEAQLCVLGNAPVLALARAAGLADEIGAFDDLCWADLFAEDGLRSARALYTLAGADLAVLWLRDPAGLATRNVQAVGIPTVLSAPGRPPEGERVHAADYLLGTLSPLLGDALVTATAQPTLVPSPEAQRWAEETWAQRGLLGVPVLALHPGSGGRFKCWPPERFAALAGRFLADGWRVVIIAGPADGAAAAAVLAALPRDRAQLVSDAALPPLAGCWPTRRSLSAMIRVSAISARCWECPPSRSLARPTLPSGRRVARVCASSGRAWTRPQACPCRR